MNKTRLLYGIFSVALWTTVLVLEGFRAKRSGEFGWFTTFVLLATAAVGVLFAIERFLAKTKGPRWMSRFHICLAIAFAVAVTILIVYVLRNYA